MKKKLLFLPAAFAAAAVDLVIKAFVRMIPEGVVFFSLPPFFDLIHTTNTGAAFSLFAGNQALVMLLSLGLLAALTVLLLRGMPIVPSASLALGCTIGGGLGNLAERFLYGGVTDYIRVLAFRFPVFNFADICVTLSIAYVMILLLTGKLEENHGEHH